MGGDMVAENSKVLRGILQGHEFKDRQMAAEKLTTGAAEAELSAADMEDNDSSEELVRNGEYDLDQDSLQSQPNSPGELSSDGLSDQENNMNGANSSKLASSMDLSQDEDDSCQNTESNEAKRARVETIICGMRTSPLRNFDNSAPPIDPRRPKRKQ